jgi:hypothetical protein
MSPATRLYRMQYTPPSSRYTRPSRSLTADLFRWFVQVKDEVWTDQKAISTTAGGVCTKQAPNGRTAGPTKCCSGTAATSSAFAPAGYSQCSVETFVGKAASPVAADVSYTLAAGFHYTGDEIPSTMITDCCESTSTCSQNQVVATAAMDAHLASMLTARGETLAKEGEKSAEVIKEGLEKSKAAAVKSMIKTICGIATDTEDVPTWPTSDADILSQCTTGQVPDTISQITALHDKVTADIASDVKIIAVINKVRTWIEESDSGSELFTDHAHGDAPTVETMTALLESAHSEANNAGAQSALEKATQLIQGSASAGRTGTQVSALFDTLIADFTASKTKKETYAASLITEKNTHLASFKAQLVANSALFTTALAQELAHQQRQATLVSEITGVSQTMTATQALYTIAFNERETNAQKCIDFMKFFDGETLINTEELLVLKKVIDIIKHVDCLGTDTPTAAPTAFPTLAPTAAVTAAATAAADTTTGTPTGFPTKAPTAATNCVAGHYRFKAVVFTDPSRYGVPAYADGVKYNIDSEMTPGSCQTIATSHTNVEGAIQVISHQYKCCGNSGSLYGSISYDDAASAAAANQLCESVDDANDHCSLFGANMDWVDATSVTDHATSANSNYDITNQE